MRSYVVKGNKELRCGYTTGACLAAAAKAAAQALLLEEWASRVQVQSLSGETIPLEIKCLEEVREAPLTGPQVKATVVKDGGDDPDATHGLDLCCTVALIPQGITFQGGPGVGRVTKPGLALAVGEPAINPGPRQMVKEALAEVSHQAGYEGGFHLYVSIPQGAKVARQTLNGKLGITGGLSILGTTGIVEPMSEKAILETINLEMDQLKAQGATKVILVPGNYGKNFVTEDLQLEEAKIVKCSNYIGEAIDHAVYLNLEVTLVGHIGKLVKLAGGIMNTYSKVADGRLEIFTAHGAMAGASQALCCRLMEAVSTEACLDLLEEAGLLAPVLESLARKTEVYLKERFKEAIPISFCVFTPQRGVLYRGSC